MQVPDKVKLQKELFKLKDLQKDIKFINVKEKCCSMTEQIRRQMKQCHSSR